MTPRETPSETTIRRRQIIIITVYLIVFTVVIFCSRTPHFFTGKLTKGVVADFTTKMIHGKGRPVESNPFPVVAFTPKNDSIIYHADLGDNFIFRKMSIGDSVTIIYNPNLPGEASYYSFPYYWIGMIEIWAGLFVLAFVFIIAGTQNYI